ncbi:isoflavone 2'-hydroxylase-like [Chenopodium quinoa]|uniref:isoflavone 2'-hydroxylase-like n=1 Tax=Chenopodium quinoa TaxID=63459 RepID=UPI000B788F18|nr:isoflavone 2'-hydroxylase-like [Chenopodium quinoa]
MMQLLSMDYDIDNIIIVIKYVAFYLATYFTLKHTILHSKVKGKLPPRPFLSFPIIGHLYLFKRPLYRSLAHLAVKYGPVLYLKMGARPVLLLSSPEAVEECLVKSDVFVDRPRLLPGKHGGNNYTNMAWSPYGDHWKNLRRIAAVEILSPQRLQILSGIRAEVAQSFICRMIKDITENDGIVEMKSAIFGLTLDNMMRMLIGKSNYVEASGGMEASRRFQKTMEGSFRVSGVNNIEDFLPILKYFKVFLGSPEEFMKKLIKEKNTFMEGLMLEHRELEREGNLSDGRKRAMIHVLLSLQKEDPHYYSDEMIGSLILALFQGGTDTSAATVEWVLSLLLNNPKVLKKAQEEIDTNIGNTRLVEESDKNNLPYLQCIINETLRMYPTGPLGLPHESRDDCYVGGYHVPKGSMLIYNIWAVHNDPNIWDDPRNFKPERFSGLEKTTLGYNFMPFGTGKRICPGEHLANKMIWLAVAILVQCFDWERTSNDLIDMEETGGLSLVKLVPLRVKCCPRPCMMNVLSEL